MDIFLNFLEPSHKHNSLLVGYKICNIFFFKYTCNIVCCMLNVGEDNMSYEICSSKYLTFHEQFISYLILHFSLFVTNYLNSRSQAKVSISLSI